MQEARHQSTKALAELDNRGQRIVRSVRWQGPWVATTFCQRARRTLELGSGFACL